MGDTSEVIRQQMKDTKIQLSEKLIALESQFSETVHSTATLVHATVEAVQETVEAVTGAVGDSVQSVKNALEFRRQINRHPLLVVGGAAVLGYLAVEFMAGSKKKSDQMPEAAHPPSPFASNTGDRNHKVSVESAAFAAAEEVGAFVGIEAGPCPLCLVVHPLEADLCQTGLWLWPSSADVPMGAGKPSFLEGVVLGDHAGIKETGLKHRPLFIDRNRMPNVGDGIIVGRVRQRAEIPDPPERRDGVPHPDKIDRMLAVILRGPTKALAETASSPEA